VRIRVKVIPNSRSEEITRQGDEFIVRVKEPPKEGRANSAVIKLLAEHFGVSRDSIKISAGLRSRHKIIEVSATEIS